MMNILMILAVLFIVMDCIWIYNLVVSFSYKRILFDEECRVMKY